MPTSSRNGASSRAVIAARMLPGVGDVAVADALQRDDLQGLFARCTPDDGERAWAAAEQALLDADRIGARVLTVRDPQYPSALRDLSDPPSVLYACGAIEMADAPAVAIVGTRGASSYGLRVARAIATVCARAGVSVVSGLAHGVDGAAHEAALAAGGRTVAVLGTGPDVVFPKRHRTLQERIAREGLLLSELSPGEHGHAGTFPRRNRVIAALAQLTVVVEAGERSGALITAAHALDLGRQVAVVPNAIDVPSASGSNALLRDANALPVLAPDDVLQLLSLDAQPTAAPLLDGDAAAVWDALQHGADDVASVAQISALSIRASSSALSALEIEGLVVVEATGRIRTTVGAMAQIAR
jgi:DNA processing protein